MGRYFDGDMFMLDLGDPDANVLLIAVARAKAMKDQERADLAAGKLEYLIDPRYLYPRHDYGRGDRYKNQSKVPQPQRYSGPLPLNT
jgi:hypothetical protein